LFCSRHALTRRPPRPGPPPRPIPRSPSSRLDYATYSPPSLVLKKQGWVEEAFKGTSVKWVYSAGSSNALNFLQGNAVDFGSTAGSAALLLARERQSQRETMTCSARC